MADTITYTTGAGPQTLTILNGFRLDRDLKAKGLATIHVPFSDVSFERDTGTIQASIQTSGLETFTSAALADAFRDQIEELQGLECVITHDTLSPVTAFALTPQAIADTNLFPGAHVTWSIPFAEYV